MQQRLEVSAAKLQPEQRGEVLQVTPRAADTLSQFTSDPLRHLLMTLTSSTPKPTPLGAHSGTSS